MKEAVKLEPDNGSGDGGLNAAQKLEVIEVVDTKVEKSENRVLRAIDALGQRMDRMDDRLDSLKTGVNIVQGAMAMNVVLTGFILWMMKTLLAA